MIRLIALLLAALAGVLVASTPAGAPVWAEPLTWEPTGLTQAVNRLFTPRSGALFAVPGTGEHPSVTGAPLRSDDGGATWRAIPLAPEASGPTEVGVVVDPLNHDILYAIWTDGIYKSEDAAGSWRKIDGPAIPRYTTDMVLDVSPADPQVVYAAIKTKYGAGSPLVWWVRRSDNGGATWQEIEQRDGALYYDFWISAFYAYPTGPNRALRALGSGGGATRGHDLELSVDRGVTWTTVISSGSGPESWYPGFFATGQDGTIYVSGNSDYREPGAVLATSTDGGQTWTKRLTAAHVQSSSVDTPWLGSGGVAADPTRPGRAYAAFNTFIHTAADARPQRTGVVVKQTDDAGQTWNDIGTGDPGELHDLAVGIDGRYLFAATETGVWRLPLP